MELLKITISNGNSYDFVGTYRNRYGGFAHDCTVFKNGNEISNATCTYINRTWESYTYQSVFVSAVYRLMERITEQTTINYKLKNGYKKLTATRKEELTEILSQNTELTELKHLNDLLSHCGGYNVTETAQ